MTTVFDACIVGGGIIGLSAALGMAQRGFQIALIDHGSLTVTTGQANPRVFAINGASKNLLSALGVWPLLLETSGESRVSSYQHMTIWDAASQGRIEFDARMIAQNTLGFIVEESVIRAALLQVLASMDHVTFFSNQTITTLRKTGNLIELASDKAQWTARFLLAADGAHSPCRSLLKVPIISRPYSQHAVVATVTTELPHQKTAYQVFNSEGPLAFLPLTAPHQCSIVWSMTPELAQELVAVTDDVFNQKLTAAFAGKLGEVRVISPRHQFPLVMRHVQQYADENWVLLGDAAHTIHPLAGLGLNLGLEDVSDWLKLLDNNPGSLPQKRHLAAYQRQRKHAVWQVILLMQGLKSLFESSWLPIRLLRGVGLQCCDRSSLLKRFFIDFAG